MRDQTVANNSFSKCYTYIAKMKREMFGPRCERSQRLLDQMELQLEAEPAWRDDVQNLSHK
jgi:hypothetical protein